MEHKAIIEQFIEEFNENEKYNLHSENTILLAVNFGSNLDVENAKGIHAKHLKLGYMSPELLLEDKNMRNKLYPQFVYWRHVYGLKKR